MTEPAVAVFACHRTAGALPHAVALPCAGRVAPGALIEAFAAGAAGVAVAPCGEAEHGCRFDHGAARAERAVATARRILGRLGLAAERIAVLPSAGELAGFRTATARLGPTGVLADWAPGDVAGLDRWMAAIAALSMEEGLTPRREDGRPQAAPRGTSAETVLWEGCTPFAELLLEEALGGTRSGDGLRELANAGVRARVLADERCCGAPLLAAGRAEEFAAVAARNAERLRAAGTRRIIARCAACARVLGHDYEAAGVRLDVEVTTLARALAKAGARCAPAPPGRLIDCTAEGEEAARRLLPQSKALGGKPLHPPGGWLGGAAQRQAVDAVLAQAARKRVDTVVATCPRCALALRLLARPGSWRPRALRVRGLAEPAEDGR
ncbi:MAG: (Fe-S)-binding protein [Deltaproteobacteria bacterium]|nr:(Fe-S)-binding protein [Deltaproteobacteria bacterium]